MYGLRESASGAVLPRRGIGAGALEIKPRCLTLLARSSFSSASGHLTYASHFTAFESDISGSQVFTRSSLHRYPGPRHGGLHYRVFPWVILYSDFLCIHVSLCILVLSESSFSSPHRLYGIFCAQVYHYFATYRDPLALKMVVLLLWYVSLVFNCMYHELTLLL